MPPRPRAPAGFASLIESDSEPDFDSFEIAAEPEQIMPPPKSRGRPASTANRVTKPAQRGRQRTTGETSRQALKETNNNMSPETGRGQKPVETQEESSLEESGVAPTRTGRSRNNAPTAGRGGLAARSGRGRPPKAKPAPVEELPPHPTDELEMGDRVGFQTAPHEEEGVLSPIAESMDGNAANVDGDDVSLRRKLGDLSRRYESLEARYRDLRDVGVKEAESNFERLKKQSEENSAGQSTNYIFIARQI